MSEKLKAYKAWDTESSDNASTVVFAKNRQQAKKIAFDSDALEYADFISVRVHRFPEMDKHYRGKSEIDWYNDQDRSALVALGWECTEPDYYECKRCPAREGCGANLCEGESGDD